MLATRNPSKEDKLLRLMWDGMSREAVDEPGVTQLIRCLTKAYYERKHLPQLPSRRVLMFYVTGLAIERALLQDYQVAYSGIIDGVSFHTDHYSEIDDEFYEIKSTRVSSARDFDGLSKSWHRQVLAYFKAVGITEGSFAVLHLMGDYKPPFPDLVVYDIVSSQREVDENWEWMRERLEVLRDHEERKQPPTQYAYRVVDWGGSDKDYECEDCPFTALCKMREQGLL